MFRATVPALKKLQPLGQRVLVRRTMPAKQTKAGVLIPEQIAGKVNEGTVVAVAAASKDWTPTVKVDDTVLLPEFGGNSVKIEGEEFFLYNEDSLLGSFCGIIVQLLDSAYRPYVLRRFNTIRRYSTTMMRQGITSQIRKRSAQFFSIRYVSVSSSSSSSSSAAAGNEGEIGRSSDEHSLPVVSSSSVLWGRDVDVDRGTFGKPHVTANTAEQVEELFHSSVIARTVSNIQLRRYLEHLEPKDHALALAAVRGAETAGLRIDTKTNEILLSKLLDGGQLRKSMELYQRMIRNRITPTSNTYARLMHMCLEREMPEMCQKLFDEMISRGKSPIARNYELYIASLAMEDPPKWEKAVEVFDHISQDRRGKYLTAATYNSLMRVYLNMKPFDWRVVYNCYQELRQRKPPIQLEWESYQIVAEALRRGRAGYIRRFLTYMDAWFAVTHFRSVDFLIGVGVYVGSMLILKTIISWIGVWYYKRTITEGRGSAESLLP
ncbi:Pentatricopeptide repeat [Trypanosoma melophagium]|uniref:Pentatricopeptide repeat n=1 Tax=Trypanosoma melophagium TaxID=715481 RepID=UPI00351A4B5D|nr:Pentatricopeptide repeat [Trypanosoma melophagium]